MIAEKREVAVCIGQVFRGANVKLGNWRQVTVQTDILQNKMRNMVCLEDYDTPGNVYSHRLSYFMKSAKRRRLFLWQVR